MNYDCDISTKVIILPLDSRPCTYDFPVQIARGGGLTPCVPEMKEMDFFKIPSVYQDLESWLLQECQDAGYLICCLDQLVYGGLIASRSSGVDEKEALRRIDVMRRIKKNDSDIRILLSSVIMRTSVSTLKKDDLRWWKLISEYCSLCGEAGEEEIRRREEILKLIPTDVMNSFLSTRKRNHGVNLEAIKLVKEGIVEELCLLQEDSSPKGIHRTEQKELLDYAGQCGVADRVHLFCGTDEYACAMAGRIALESSRPQKQELYLYIEWLQGDKNFTAKYEDRPFSQNLKAYLEACHIIETNSLADAEAILAIYAPTGAQCDLALNPEKAECPYTSDQLNECAERLYFLEKSGLPVGLLDVVHANGGESTFLRLCAKEGILDHLAAYAGWNTACNSLGTILGELTARKALYANPDQLDIFTRERLLDDWIYQAIVRPKWNEILEKEGLDRWNLTDTKKESHRLQTLMEETPETKLVCHAPFCACLRWPRTFEVSIRCLVEGKERI